jgi:hypothetical protein
MRFFEDRSFGGKIGDVDRQPPGTQRHRELKGVPERAGQRDRLLGVGIGQLALLAKVPADDLREQPGRLRQQRVLADLAADRDCSFQ